MRCLATGSLFALQQLIKIPLDRERGAVEFSGMFPPFGISQTGMCGVFVPIDAGQLQQGRENVPMPDPPFALFLQGLQPARVELRVGGVGPHEKRNPGVPGRGFAECMHEALALIIEEVFAVVRRVQQQYRTVFLGQRGQYPVQECVEFDDRVVIGVDGRGLVLGAGVALRAENKAERPWKQSRSVPHTESGCRSCAAR